MRREDLSGQRFGRLTVIDFAGFIGRRTAWRCKCECGESCVSISCNLKSGHTKSCGCWSQESRSIVHRKHGHCANSKGGRTTEFTAWVSMRSRCYDPSDINYPNYGGLGISVCIKWRRSFSAFLSDVGLKPSPGHSLDRYPNNSGNYEPGNVRWATDAEQRRNKRTNVWIEINGVSRTISDWADLNGISRQTVNSRRRSGWPLSDCVSIPVAR